MIEINAVRVGLGARGCKTHAMQCVAGIGWMPICNAPYKRNGPSFAADGVKVNCSKCRQMMTQAAISNAVSQAAKPKTEPVCTRDVYLGDAESKAIREAQVAIRLHYNEQNGLKREQALEMIRLFNRLMKFSDCPIRMSVIE